MELIDPSDACFHGPWSIDIWAGNYNDPNMHLPLIVELKDGQDFQEIMVVFTDELNYKFRAGILPSSGGR